jgi:alcohol dehydrogenase (cytochrome c)/quinohemoprotein ethanol dehydrogenase
MSMPTARIAHIAALACLVLSACQRTGTPNETTAENAASAARAVKPAAVDAARLAAADQEPGQWMSHGRTYDEQRYSPLERINAGNVAGLKLAWHHDLDAIARGQSTTPLVIDGVMYVTSTWSKVFALNAVTGKLLWTYDPRVPGEWGVNACCDVVNRGVAAWNGKIYVGTLDGRLVALDAVTGKPVWEKLTIDRNQRYAITGAPRVLQGKVLIGNAGSEFGVRGYISAYDAETGAQLWRFYTVPGDPAKGFENVAMERAATTWKGQWWKMGGGGTVWETIAYDPKLDLVYFGTGNGVPWSRKLRSPGGGDNLYIASIIALKASTGEYAWHYQTTPGEIWDFDATAQLMLADLPVNGQTRQVIMQANKNGYFYVLDRATGQLLSAKAFTSVNWATGIDLKTGRPVENPQARYDERGTTFTATPGAAGGHSWHAMSYSPRTGLVYIPALDMGMSYTAQPLDVISRYKFNIGYDFVTASLPQDPKIKAAAKETTTGRLLAWNPVTQTAAWSVTYSAPWTGGTVATAGNLVFQGTALGEFIAYQADTGRKLWSAPTQAGITASPITYEVGGRQYVAIETGWGGAFAISAGEIALAKRAPTNTPRLLVFALDGTDSLPPAAIPAILPLNPPPEFGNAAIVARGMRIYHPYCSNCHGDAAVSGSFIPDLQHSPALADAAAWERIVLKGERSARGMVGFAAELSAADAEAVRAYVVSRAHETLARAE